MSHSFVPGDRVLILNVYVPATILPNTTDHTIWFVFDGSTRYQKTVMHDWVKRIYLDNEFDLDPI